MSLRTPLLLAAALLMGAASVARADSVDTALVLAVDVSLSVGDQEYTLQRDGIATAFESPALVSAVAGGKNHAIDVLVLEWSDPEIQVVTVDWTRVSDAASANAFAAKVRSTKRSSQGLTAIGNGMMAAGAAFERLPDQTARRVIDVSGDGMANIGMSCTEARDALLAKGITINGLVMINDEPWVDGFYNDSVVGGPGAFLMQVADYQEFAAAIREKLLSEIVGLPHRAVAPPS
ncbi:MAG TPA: DUF1194 domain-containing protein [Stellaceae bacterium]|nr:DUF1194 domain-containing protein [Stellaceae bacterium]